MNELGAPAPRTQVVVRSPRGEQIGRVDFFWDEGVVGEADGRMKYLQPEDLYAEKIRQERLEDLNLTVVRWGWPDVATDAALMRLALRLDRARARA